MKTHQAPTRHKWLSGTSRHFPWLALASLAVFVVCCIGLVLVLYTSDGKPVESWPSSRFRVSTADLLLPLVSIADVSLGICLKKGYETAWWVKAMEGADLQTLQFNLGIQQTLRYLFGRGATINAFSIAAIIAVVVPFIDGPLIHQSSSVVVASLDPVAQAVTVPVLDGYLPGDFSAHGKDADLLPTLFTRVKRAYEKRDPIHVPISVCSSGSNTTCSVEFPGLGFDVQCSTSSEEAYDFEALRANDPKNNNVTGYSVALEFGDDGTGNEASPPNVGWVFDHWVNIKYTAVYKADSSKKGNLTKRTCRLRYSRVSYPLVITNGTAAILPWDTDRNDTIAWINESDNVPIATVTESGTWTALGGVHNVLKYRFAASAYFLATASAAAIGAPCLIIRATSTSASHYVSSDASTYGNYTVTWADPTDDFINAARELMLRSVLSYAHAAPGNMTTQTSLDARVAHVSAVYRSEYRFLAATIASLGVYMLIALFLLKGWHHIGRTVSLDTFEIARALGAPLLQGGSSNSEIAETIEPIRRLHLQYGEVQADSKDGSSNTLVNGADDRRTPRLGLVESSRAGPIRKDVPY